MKKGIRAVGIDDGPQKNRTLLAGVVMRKDRLEGILSRRVSLDGDDATDAVIRMVDGRFLSQLRCIFLDGVAVAGFNLLDFHRISSSLSVPTIVCTSNQPHPALFEEALRRWPDKLQQWKNMKTPSRKLGNMWYQFSGCTRSRAEALIKHFRVHTDIPEPLRLAHIISTGIETGESSGL